MQNLIDGQCPNIDSAVKETTEGKTNRAARVTSFVDIGGLVSFYTATIAILGML